MDECAFRVLSYILDNPVKFVTIVEITTVLVYDTVYDHVVVPGVLVYVTTSVQNTVSLNVDGYEAYVG